MINPKPFDSDELYDKCSSASKEVKCFCGKAAFTVFNGRVRKARECACIECYQHLTWANSKGGPEVPSIIPLSYWDNDVRMDQGENNLIVVMLRESGKSKRLVAKCCYSTLMVDHIGYKRLRFLLFENACKIPWDNETAPPSVTRPPSDRIFMRDWDGSRGELPEFKGDPSRIDQGCCPPFTDKTNWQSIDNLFGKTCQSIFQRVPWYTLEMDEGVIPKNKGDWPELKPIEPR